MEALFPPFVQVHVTFRPRRQEDRAVRVPPGATIGDVLAAAGQPVDATVVVRDGRPVPETEAARDGDRLVLLSSFSGG